MVFQFRQDGSRHDEAVDDGVARHQLRILGIGDPEEAGVEVRVMGEQDGALAAEGGELLEAFAYRRGVFDHRVGNVVHAARLGGNKHVRLHERLEFRDKLGDHAARLGLDGEFHGADFDDFIFLVNQTSRFQVKCNEFRG